MLEPRITPATRAWLERLQALPINPAERGDARAEFLRAEAAADNVVGFAARLRNALTGIRRAFAVRRRRLG